MFVLGDPLQWGNTLILVGYVSELVRHLIHLRPHGRPTPAVLWRLLRRATLPVLAGLTLSAGYALTLLGKGT